MNKQIDFIVIDNNTGKQADISEIALKEYWAKELMYCDMEGFAINENGQLVLLDECGNFAYCPYDRFTVKFENSVVLTMTEHAKLVGKVRQEFEYEYKDKVVLSREEYEEIKTERKNLVNKYNQADEAVDYWCEKFKQARKETAREILNEVKLSLEDCSMFENVDLEQLEFDGATIKEILNEIAKQYGVEIKE